MIPYVDEQSVPVMDKWFAVSYGSLHRVAWAGSIGWIIIACVNGYGGISLIHLITSFYLIINELQDGSMDCCAGNSLFPWAD